MTREEQLAALIALPPGYEIGMFGRVSVYRLEDGRYAVSSDSRGFGKAEDIDETVHETALEAATEFERVRRVRELGYEFEVDPPPKC